MEGGDGSVDIRLGFVFVQEEEREGYGVDVVFIKEIRKFIQVIVEVKELFFDFSEIEKVKERLIL